MDKNQFTTVDSAINFALHTVSPEKIAPLFAKFGYKPDEISLETTIELWDVYGDDFIVPFAEMAQEVLHDGDQMAEIKRHYLSLDRATGAKRKKAVWRGDGQPVATPDGSDDETAEGESAAGTSTDDTSAKFDTAMNYMDKIWGQIGKGGSTIIDLVNKGKGGAGSQPADPKTTPSGNQPKGGTDSGSIWLIVGVVLVVVVLIVLLVFAAKK